MRMKLISMLHCAAGISLPLLSGVALAARRPQLPLFPAQPTLPPQAPIAQADMPAMVMQMTAHVAMTADWKMRLLWVLAGALLGGLTGVFLSERARKLRRWFALAIMAILLILGVIASNVTAFLSAAIASTMIALVLLRLPLAEGFEPIFGNAHPATHTEIIQAGHMRAYDPEQRAYTGKVGIPLGRFANAGH